MRNGLITTLLCAAMLAFFGPAHADAFRAGAAFRVVTPDPLLPVSGGVGKPNPVTAKNGDLFARAMVFEKGDTRVAVVSLDFLGWPAVQGNKIRAQVKGIPPENILIGVTHTHSAPDPYAFPDEQGRHGAALKYLDWVCEQAAAAVNEAIDRREPAVLKPAVGDAKGKIAYNYYAPELYDPRCGVIQPVAAAGSNKGKPIATLINYASHPEIIGSEQGLLGPDFCGPLYDRVAAQGGGMAIYMNSAQGGMVTADCRGPDGKDIQTWDECVRIGNLLADEALRIVSAAPIQENPTLYCTSSPVTFPVESPILLAVTKNSVLDYGLTESNEITSRINLVNVGTAQVLTIPGEALPNIGYYVKRHMPTSQPFLFGLTNDAFGYMLAKVDWSSFRRYNYITRTCLGEMTGEIYMDAALALIKASPKPDSAEN